MLIYSLKRKIGGQRFYNTRVPMPNVQKYYFFIIIFPTNASSMIKTTLKQKPIKSWFHTCSLENIKYYWMKEVTQELGRTGKLQT